MFNEEYKMDDPENENVDKIMGYTATRLYILFCGLKVFVKKML